MKLYWYLRRSPSTPEGKCGTKNGDWDLHASFSAATTALSSSTQPHRDCLTKRIGICLMDDSVRCAGMAWKETATALQPQSGTPSAALSLGTLKYCDKGRLILWQNFKQCHSFSCFSGRRGCQRHIPIIVHKSWPWVGYMQLQRNRFGKWVTKESVEEVPKGPLCRITTWGGFCPVINAMARMLEDWVGCEKWFKSVAVKFKWF